MANMQPTILIAAGLIFGAAIGLLVADLPGVDAYEFLKDQGSIIGALITLFAGGLAFWAVIWANNKEDRRRERAGRIALANTLGALCDKWNSIAYDLANFEGSAGAIGAWPTEIPHPSEFYNFSFVASLAANDAELVARLSRDLYLANDTDRFMRSVEHPDFADIVLKQNLFELLLRTIAAYDRLAADLGWLPHRITDERRAQLQDLFDRSGAKTGLSPL